MIICTTRPDGRYSIESSPGLWFMVHGSVLGSVYDSVYGLVNGLVHGFVHDSWFHSNIFICKGLLPELCTPFTFTQAH